MVIDERLNTKLFNVSEIFVENQKEVGQEISLETYFDWKHNESYRIQIEDLNGFFGP